LVEGAAVGAADAVLDLAVFQSTRHRCPPRDLLAKRATAMCGGTGRHPRCVGAGVPTTMGTGREAVMAVRDGGDEAGVATAVVADVTAEAAAEVVNVPCRDGEFCNAGVEVVEAEVTGAAVVAAAAGVTVGAAQGAAAAAAAAVEHALAAVAAAAGTAVEAAAGDEAVLRQEGHGSAAVVAMVMAVRGVAALHTGGDDAKITATLFECSLALVRDQSLFAGGTPAQKARAEVIGIDVLFCFVSDQRSAQISDGRPC